jgi:hypothetical protein
MLVANGWMLFLYWTELGLTIEFYREMGVEMRMGILVF